MNSTDNITTKENNNSNKTLENSAIDTVSNNTSKDEPLGTNESSTSKDSTEPEATNFQKLFSVLFVNNKPISLEKLATAVDADSVSAIISDLEKLNQECEQLGVEIAHTDGGVQLRTIKLCAPTVRKVIKAQARKLTKATAETLALVAYRQPITKADIESIRGVDSAPTLKTLLEMKLVQNLGRDESAGSPILYGTTSIFLERFGLSSLDDLPNKREINEIESTSADLTE